jgi:glycosyltransferase involved in cell wall biosynthesis
MEDIYIKKPVKKQTYEISVIVPCYKQAEFLDECISSVIEQTFQNWECIIVDDGSPDNTEEVSREWCKKDSRIKYYKKTNEGVSKARNHGISLAAGKYILPLDADDKIGRQYMELALQYFQKDNNVKVVYCRAKYFGKKRGIWHLPEYSYKKLLTMNIIFCSAFFPKIEWERIGGYDVNMVEGLEDWEFWINMLSNDIKVKRIDSVQFYYRIRRNSRTSTAVLNIDKLLNYVCEKHVPVYNKIVGNHIFLNAFRETKEYKLGKIILFLPRIIWNIFKKIKKSY